MTDTPGMCSGWDIFGSKSGNRGQGSLFFSLVGEILLKKSLRPFSRFDGRNSREKKKRKSKKRSGIFVETHTERSEKNLSDATFCVMFQNVIVSKPGSSFFPFVLLLCLKSRVIIL